MAQINGTPNADLLQGGNESDVIHAGDGNDTVFANDGNDEVFGEGGNDYVVGGRDSDTLWGGDGDDELAGFDGNDVVRGQAGVDRLTGGAGDDDLQGGDDGDTLYGDTGDSYSYSGDGADTLDGGSGNDLIYAGGGNDTVLGGADFDQLTGGAGSDLIDGGDGDDFINGEGGLVFGGVEDDVDTLLGGAGNDNIGAGYGDTVDGGTGTDTLYLSYYSGATAGVIADFRQLAGNGTITIGGGTIGNIEYIGRYSLTQFDDKIIAGARGEGWTYLEISGWGGNDELTGTAGIDNIYGGDGDDLIHGGGGSDPSIYPSGDRLRGEAGNDVIHMGNDDAEGSGGSGNDRIYGGNGDDSMSGDGDNDILQGGGGDDGILGGEGDDIITGGAGNDFLSGGNGRDTLDYSKEEGGQGVYVNMSFDLMPGPGAGGFLSPLSASDSYGDSDTIDSVENVVTGSGNDVVYGSAIANRIETGAGHDLLLGGGGGDLLIGGSGDDTYMFVMTDPSSVPGGTIVELAGGGWDEVVTTFASFSIAGMANVENLTSYSETGGTLTGNGLDNVIVGGSGDDVIEGRDGHDDLDGDAGDDILHGEAGDDWLYVWGSGTEVAEGGSGTDLLSVDYGDSDLAISMAAPTADPAGGHSGSLGDGAGRQVSYSSIENFSIVTGSGNDLVRGGSGENYAHLGGGDDHYVVAGGFNSADGGEGVDGLTADFGAGSAPIVWNLVTGSHNQMANYFSFEYFHSLITGGGQDHITTANVDRADSLILGTNNDSAILWNGHDVVNGGAPNQVSTDSGLDTLILNYGAATAGVHNYAPIQSNAAGAYGQIGDGATRSATFAAIDRFLIATGSGSDNISTIHGNDEIRTGGGNDVVNSGGGDDLIDGGAGDDSMTGGGGNDLYFVDSAGDLVIEAAGGGTDEIRTALTTYSLVALSNVEKLTATSNIAHDFRGNAGNNVITGGGGADFLRLYDGGTDTVLAGAGNDNIFFGATLDSADIVNGGDGGDVLILQGSYAGGLLLSGNVTQIEGVSILGGNNTFFGEPGTNRYDYVLTTSDVNFAAGLQVRVNGAALLADEDFTFNGSAESDASFVVYGGKGKDTLTGGLGNDIFFYAEERFASGDTVNGGSGYDGMFLRGNYTIDFNAPGYTGLFASIENLTLTSATDERYARGGGTEFDYNLTLSNVLVGAGEVLTISGALLMATETMILDGSLESDGVLRLFGGKAADTLKGGALADILHGNQGADQLAGNGGADTFRFDNITESNSANMDQILDFTPGTDKTELTRVDANSLVAGNQAFSWIGSNAFSGSAGQLRAFQSGSNWIVEGDVNGDSVADLVISLTLQGPTPLGAGDFLL